LQPGSIARLVSALVVAVALGCKGEERTRCSLGAATRVAHTGAARLDVIALTGRGTQALAGWSDASGSWLRWLDGQDTTTHALGTRCEGGLGLALEADALWVACLAPRRGEQAGSVSLERLDPRTLEPTARGTLAQVGREARGLALALSDQLLYVAWADGEVGRPGVMLLELPRSALAAGAAPRALSSPDANGREPSLLVHAGVPWAVWTESDLTPGKERHRLMLQRGSAPPLKLVDVGGATPSPVLAQDAEGILVAFRSQKRGTARAELYVGRLDPAGHGFKAPPRSIGRANGEGGPSLALCAKTRAAVVPIDHAGELFVAFHPLSRALLGTEENHQYYESGRELTLSASACVDGYPRALIAERTEAARPAARLLTTAFHCSP
jgi:hypothetical protein